ncbi:hypothetical protein ARMSODRAFT_538429 [Armillaria solidipes]|uniref:Uncharacterized protein n=1 Tax=Armillaria solidipes TaxID=1076256 RepID=A0A2H3BKG7_9AGAR|nr:hypothetical protein ARMSODRAFT_538429 [Armillaria solidipes]
MLESIYSIFSSKKSGLGTTQYHDTPVWTTIFCDSLNAPPSLPKLSLSLGSIRCSEHKELRLSRSYRASFGRTLDKDMWYWILDGLAFEISTSGSWAGEFTALVKLDIPPYSSAHVRRRSCNTTISPDTSPCIARHSPKLITGCVVCSQQIRLYVQRGLVLQCSKLR